MIKLERLIEIVAATGMVGDIGGFDPDRSFKENGVDSLDVMSILLKIEETLQVKFSEEEFEKIRSLADVSKVLSSRN